MCSGSCTNQQQTCSCSGEVVGRRYLECDGGSGMYAYTAQ